MFKRANKITALLVAAASVMAVVPAMAADTTRLGTKDGTIEDAISFGDGKYLFQGYKSDDNDAGLYYSDGKSDKLLDDATTFATTTAAAFEGSSFSTTTVKFGDKYVMAEDGTDQYIIDLATGKVSDEDVQADVMDNVRTKLKSKLTKTDRYSANGSDVEIKAVDNNKFAETWYEFRATTSGSAAGALDGFGFTTDGSKYIDASDLANISIYVADNHVVTNKVVKVEEFGDQKDGVTAYLNNVEFLAQDKDNIYVKTTVTVTGAGAVSDGTRTFVQKLSKAQGDKKDDAFIPKTVTSYEYDNEVVYKDDDTKDAYGALTSSNIVNVSAIDGSLYVTTNSGSNVKVAKLDLKKAKMDSNITSKTNIDAYVVKQDDTSDQDIASGKKGWSVDANGYTWVINEGKIYKFDKLEKKTVYTCDRSLDTLDVYDDNNLVAWEDGADVYTTVTEGKAETSTEANVVAPAAPTTGWVKNADGTWSWNDYTGAKVAAKWINDKGTWYFLKADGIMATGWYNDNGTWYYLNPSSGAMATGWLNDNGTWYYLAGSGAMLANTTVDGYVLGASGAWVK